MKMIMMFAVAAAAVSTMSAFGADKVDIGKREFEHSCATCHGLDGKGKGPFAQVLHIPVSDLTTLAKRNGGAFPVSRVYNVIDGREEVTAHGARDMPIWGVRYSVTAAPMYDDYAYNPEVAVRGRILSLIDYIYRLQVK